MKTTDELIASEITHLIHSLLIKFSVFTDVITSLRDKTVEVFNVDEKIVVVANKVIKTKYGQEWSVYSRKGKI